MDWRKLDRKINGEWEAEYRLNGNRLETRWKNRYYPGSEYTVRGDDYQYDGNMYNAITRQIATLLPYMDEDARLRSLLKNAERNMEAKGIVRRETA